MTVVTPSMFTTSKWEHVHVSVTAWQLLLLCCCLLNWKKKLNQWILLHFHVWYLCLSSFCHFSVTSGFSLPSSFFSSCCVVCHTVIGEKFSTETWNHRTCWSMSEESLNWQTLVSAIPVSCWFHGHLLTWSQLPDLCHQFPDFAKTPQTSATSPQTSATTPPSSATSPQTSATRTAESLQILCHWLKNLRSQCTYTHDRW